MAIEHKSLFLEIKDSLVQEVSCLENNQDGTFEIEDIYQLSMTDFRDSSKNLGFSKFNDEHFFFKNNLIGFNVDLSADNSKQTLTVYRSNLEDCFRAILDAIETSVNNGCGVSIQIDKVAKKFYLQYLSLCPKVPNYLEEQISNTLQQIILNNTTEEDEKKLDTVVDKILDIFNLLVCIGSVKEFKLAHWLFSLAYGIYPYTKEKDYENNNYHRSDYNPYIRRNKVSQFGRSKSVSRMTGKMAKLHSKDHQNGHFVGAKSVKP